MKALLVMTLLAAGPEFRPNPGYCPAPGDKALLHATSRSGRATDVVLGRSEAAYARYLEQSFRDSQVALKAAENDPELVVLPYGTEVVVERIVRGSVWTGRRVVARWLLSVRPVGGPTGEPSLLVLDIHVQRPLSESAARALADRYEAYARARYSAEEARATARWDTLRRSQEEFQGQRLARLLWLRDSTPYVNCTPSHRLVIPVPIFVPDTGFEDAAAMRCCRATRDER
jgi:hypothetical protein